jgi:Mn2+/Fe2+ NRAMP family transporter
LAKPDPGEVLRGTFMPRIEFNGEFLSMIVACIGASLSAYIYTWQSNQEVEEQLEEGKPIDARRRGASEAELQRTRRDIMIGMAFSNVILYFIIMATGATLHSAGKVDIETAAEAAAALEPLAGKGAEMLFAAGVVGVGFLAVPVMTAGAAYDVAQGLGRQSSLHATPREAPLFYATIAIVTLLAVLLNFLGLNPMKVLVWSGIVQGFFSSSVAFPHHADDQRSRYDGRQGQRPPHQHARLDHDCGYIRRIGMPCGELVDVRAKRPAPHQIAS